MRPPTIGQFKSRVTLHLWQDRPADGGGIDPQTTKQNTLWAKIEPVGGGIYVGGLQVGHVVTHRITIRYRPGITTSHIVRHGCAVYRVKRVTDVNGAGRFSMLEVEEESNHAHQPHAF